MSNSGCPCGEPEKFRRALHSSKVQKNTGQVQKNAGRKNKRIQGIEKTNTNVARNNCQAKYDDSKCKTTDLLQAMTCIASK